eukprot:8824107-Heterocapsa_arctica.AAC.1
MHVYPWKSPSMGGGQLRTVERQPGHLILAALLVLHMCGQSHAFSSGLIRVVRCAGSGRGASFLRRAAPRGPWLSWRGSSRCGDRPRST